MNNNNINLLIHNYIIPRGIITTCYHIKHLMIQHIVYDTPIHLPLHLQDNLLNRETLCQQHSHLEKQC